MAYQHQQQKCNYKSMNHSKKKDVHFVSHWMMMIKKRWYSFELFALWVYMNDEFYITIHTHISKNILNHLFIDAISKHTQEWIFLHLEVANSCSWLFVHQTHEQVFLYHRNTKNTHNTIRLYARAFGMDRLVIEWDYTRER